MRLSRSLVADSKEWVGSRRSDLPTPSLVLEMSAFRRNAERVSSEVRSNGAVWRPHVKAHRSPFLAKVQREVGAGGITCGTAGDAVAFVAGGFEDVLIANVITAPPKWAEVARLQRAANVTACVDDPLHVERASNAAREAGVVIPLYVELDIGLHRTGAGDLARFRELAALILDTDSVSLSGVMGYEGHCLAVWPRFAKEEACREAIDELIGARDVLMELGVGSPVVSCGGTGTYDIVSRIEGVTEIQAGGGCLMDVLYADVFHVSGLETALLVEANVVSVGQDGTAIVDAGLKAIAAHKDVMPRVAGHPGANFVRLAAEHGRVEVLEKGSSLAVGQRVALIPGRVDTTVFLYDEMFVVEDDQVVEVLSLVRNQW